MSYVIGVDTGGTFTDTVVVDDGGTRTTGKAPTTPRNPAEGVMDSLESVVSNLNGTLDDLLADTEVFFHGTTLTTNAVIERTGSDIGLITTRGNRDVLSIGRVKTRHEGLSHEELQNFAEQTKPDLIMPKQQIYEIDERVDYSGEVIVPLDEEQVREALNELSSTVDTVAVSFLWSFRNSDHERRVAEIAADEVPRTPLYVASDIAPKMGEYERMATTVINAYTAPVLENYVETLEAELTNRGLDAPLYLMQSSGGVTPISEVSERAVGTIGSGPAGGVTGSRFIGRKIGHENLICTDVGGTSFDVGLVVDGELQMRPTTTVQRYTLYQPAVDIESIGSGGGSIAFIDDAGALRVGPESAGADPGPACYGWGGTNPTVTDADLLLGYLDPEFFLGGQHRLDRDAARAAMAEHVADPLDVEIEAAAEGIFEIANAAMSDLIRNVTVEQGFDPRDFSIFAYGGAGPLHASFYGGELGVDAITIPLGDTASVFSAFGISTSSIRYVEEVSEPATAPFDPDQLMAGYTRLETDIEEKCASAGIDPLDITFSREAELRYQEQVHQVDVAVPAGALTEEEIEQTIDRFEETYETLYGIGAHEGAEIELVTLRVYGNVEATNPTLERAGDTAEDAYLKTRDVYWPSRSEFVETEIYDGEWFDTGVEVDGPAVIHLPDTTVTVRPHQRASVDRHRDIVLRGER